MFKRIVLIGLTLFLVALPGLAKPLKIATYNIYFLVDDISPERKAHLQSVIEHLDADVIAFQEIKDVAALRNILGPEYRIAMVDDPHEVQDLALAVRTPLEIIAARTVFPSESYDFQFPRSRDLLEVRVGAMGHQLVFLVHHAKSRRGGRMQTDARREAAAEMIVGYIQSKLADNLVVLLGDFNDNPDDRSVNILEYGDPQAPAGIDTSEDTFLYNVTESLMELDYCSYGLSYRLAGQQVENFDPAVPGAREENNKWRGKNYDYYQDVKIKAILIDQILVSQNLKPYVKGVGIYNRGDAVVGEPSQISFKGGFHYVEKGSLASDHAPVWMTIELPGAN